MQSSTEPHNLANPVTVEAVLGIEETAPLDYSIYPAFDASIGFTQRGCRLKCGFCVVPKKEGKNHSAAPSRRSGVVRLMRNICICSTTTFSVSRATSGNPGGRISRLPQSGNQRPDDR